MEGLLDSEAVRLGITLALLGGGVLLDGVAQARGWGLYHRLGFPVGVEPVPLARAPRGAGASHGVAWRVVGPEVRFRAKGPGAPRGLHGTALLAQDRHGRVHLDVRWAPAWTPLLALTWLSVLAVARGDGWLLVPVAVALGLAWLVVHARVAPSLVQALVASLGATTEAPRAFGDET